MHIVIIGIVLLFLAGVLSMRLGPDHLRSRGAANPHVLDMNFNFNPHRELLKIAASTGKHWNNVFLRDYEGELIDAEMRALTDENEVLKNAAQVRVLDEAAIALKSTCLSGPPFKPDEPTSFATYEGQPHITVPLEKALLALPDDKLVLDHKLFTGLPGLGKTLIAKVIGAELHRRALSLGKAGVPFYWAFAANLNKAEMLDAFVKEIIASRGGVWFIDEIHVLDDKLQTKIYSMMEDGLYPFEGDTNPTKVPDTMIIGATTDYGSMHAALKRRFGESMMLRRLPREAIIKIVTNREFPIQGGAASLLADRTHYSGAPWEALILRREAEIFAKAVRRKLITEVDVKEVFDIYGIDELGLRWEDREVLKALFQRPRHRGKDKQFVAYAASESDICAVAGLDPEEYRDTVKARLLSRGLLEIRAGYGQALTPKAVEAYKHLIPS